MPSSLGFGIQSPVPGLARDMPTWTGPGMIEMREIERQFPLCQVCGRSNAG